MARPHMFRRTLLAIGAVTAFLFLSLYFVLQAFPPDRWFVHQSELAALPAGAAAADTSVAADTSGAGVPAGFAELFHQRYSFDSSAGPLGELVIDTSYVASPREQAMRGRKVSVAVCGVDSRLGERMEHADANHVVTFWLDSGMVEIASIPRDTPCDAGYGGGSRNNNLANLRARKGRDAYLKEIASIAGLDTIEYYVDLGFSQARGVLELLGFRENASDALRVLRSRQIFASGDFQRSFNQGQFIRQTLLEQFGRLEGISGGLLLRAGLYLVTTNLTVADVERIAGEMRQRGFPRDRQAVSVAIRPAYYARMSVFDFSDSLAMGSLLSRINRKAQQLGIGAGSDSAMGRFRGEIEALIARGASDTARLPVRTIAVLRRPFEQRVWWQLSGGEERARVRAGLGAVLAHAYEKTGRAGDAARVREVVRFEEEMRGL